MKHLFPYAMYALILISIDSGMSLASEEKEKQLERQIRQHFNQKQNYIKQNFLLQKKVIEQEIKELEYSLHKTRAKLNSLDYEYDSQKSGGSWCLSRVSHCLERSEPREKLRNKIQALRESLRSQTKRQKTLKQNLHAQENGQKQALKDLQGDRSLSLELLRQGQQSVLDLQEQMQEAYTSFDGRLGKTEEDITTVKNELLSFENIIADELNSLNQHMLLLENHKKPVSIPESRGTAADPKQTEELLAVQVRKKIDPLIHLLREQGAEISLLKEKVTGYDSELHLVSEQQHPALKEFSLEFRRNLTNVLQVYILLASRKIALATDKTSHGLKVVGSVVRTVPGTELIAGSIEAGLSALKVKRREKRIKNVYDGIEDFDEMKKVIQLLTAEVLGHFEGYIKSLKKDKVTPEARKFSKSVYHYINRGQFSRDCKGRTDLSRGALTRVFMKRLLKKFSGLKSKRSS